MNEHNDDNQFALSRGGGEHNEASSNIFLDMSERDSTGIPSLTQAPVSAISSSSSDSKFNVQIVIAICVLAIGGGAIYAMRYIGMQAGLDEQVHTIDYTSETNSADFSHRYSSVMRALEKSKTSVELADQSDFAPVPFSHPVAVKEDQIPVDPGMSKEERLALQKERDQQRAIKERRDSVIGEAMRFKLQGIIGGSRPAARVSGQPVRAGMKLGEYFTVQAITGRSVIIEGDGLRFELVMGQETKQLE